MKQFHNTGFHFITIITLQFIIVLFNGCQKDQLGELNLITKPAHSISQTRALVECDVTNESGKDRINYGICWDLNPNPTVNSTKIEKLLLENKNGFSIQLKHLIPDRTYYARSYASGNNETVYGNEISFTTLQGTIGQITDIDGNVYNTVIIGEQVWMVENLKTTRFRNGDPIPYVSDISQWDTLTSGAYCYYDNDISNAATYGNLYNWYAAADTRNIAPAGWHAATDSDWLSLVTFLSNLVGFNRSDRMLIEDGTEYWLNNNYPPGELNETGFTALPGGKLGQNGFENINEDGYWWSTTEYYPSNTYYWRIFIGYWGIERKSDIKTNGFSVRCVKDQLND